jgi:hypothetical protein
MPPADPWAFGVNHVVWLTVAGIAFLGVAFTVFQKHKTDKRNELWSWISWALKLVTEGDESARETGLNALDELLAADEEEEQPVLEVAVGTYVTTEPRRSRLFPKPPAPLTEYDMGRLLNVASVYRVDGTLPKFLVGGSK